LLPTRMQTEEEAEHDSTVLLLAGSRFAYPDEEHPDWTTHANVPERTKGIQHESELVYPDLAVVSTKMEVVKVVEVQSRMAVDQEDLRLWRIYSSLSRAFYLYIPLQTRARVLQVLNFHRIHYKALYLYAYDSGGRLLVEGD